MLSCVYCKRQALWLGTVRRALVLAKQTELRAATAAHGEPLALVARIAGLGHVGVKKPAEHIGAARRCQGKCGVPAVRGPVGKLWLSAQLATTLV